ncbi:hypothetical protein M0811_00625 [Anaeramoeba ignava]|uniref:Uncharacterized protein n=1 Tax=Anaeramoeba ignava TaxID=1746090 RepID=A0A9Q0LRF3_ANAIG|nr:hypothetical protein M0811_00625 [Anaeramoeba ignava]
MEDLVENYRASMILGAVVFLVFDFTLLSVHFSFLFGKKITKLDHVLFRNESNHFTTELILNFLSLC